MSHVIGIINQKGGVGKTTTSVNLAACLAARERKTLLVDMDPQGNATSSLGVRATSQEPTAYEILLNTVEPRDALLRTRVPNLDILPGSIGLVGAEIELVDLPDRSHRLALAMDRVLPEYQYVVVDAPPSLGLLTLNVLVFARSVIIPVQAEYFALEGLSMLMTNVERIQRTLNPALSVQGIVITMYDGRTNLSREVCEELRRVFGELVFRTVIHRAVKVSECASHGKPMILYDLSSAATQSYIALAKEVVDACEKESSGPGP